MRASLTTLTLLMAGTVSAQTYFPADGIWQFPDANGSGFTLDFRDGTIGVGLYTYDEDGHAVWYSGAGQLVDGVLDAGLLRFSSEGGTPVQVGEALDFRMSFSSATTAMLTLDDGAPLAVRHALFGVDTIDQLALLDDEGYVRSVPDMRGRWVITQRGEQGLLPPAAYEVVFNQGVRHDDVTVTFDSEPIPTMDADATDYYLNITCTTSPTLDMPPMKCYFYARNPPFIGPVPSLPLGHWGPGDLSTMHIASDVEIGGNFVGFRVPEQANAPMPGIWQIQGRYGEGVSIDVRPDNIAVGVFGYDDNGDATWSLATGALDNNVLSAELATFSVVACLGCDDGTPAIAAQRPMRLEFVTPTRALLSIGDDAPLALSLLPFGAEYLQSPIAGDPDRATFGPHLLPTLLGSWVRTGVVGEADEDQGFPTQPAVQFEIADLRVEGSGQDHATTSLTAASLGHWGAWPHWHDESTSLLCGSESTPDEQMACVLQFYPGPYSPPIAPYTIADLAPSNITATRISAVGNVAHEPVYVFRIPPHHTAASD